MVSRRRIVCTLAGVPLLGEIGFAQRALVRGNVPPDAVWLNANENPEGPPQASMEAMSRSMPKSWRYHYQYLSEYYEAIARGEGLDLNQVLVGAGSSEVIHAAVAAFTSPSRPLLVMDPTFELPEQLAAAYNRPIEKAPLKPDYSADIDRMASIAREKQAGLVYVCNPNNPTSSITSRPELERLVSKLPSDTVTLIDEAYIHFEPDYEKLSAMEWVKQGKNVMVARTFSKIYGMAGLRVGFLAARPELIEKARPFRNNVISIVSASAARAAVEAGKPLLDERRKRLLAVRGELCSWLRSKSVRYIEPHTNFMMIETGRDVREVLPKVYAKGVVPGRFFPALPRMMRVTIGTAAEMEKFRQAFQEVVL